MNNIEKVKYIVELKALTTSLENDSLSLFETAKAKKRLQDICALFDEPIFQQYLPKNFVKNEVKIVASQLTQRGVISSLSQPIKTTNTPLAKHNSQNLVDESHLTSELVSEEKSDVPKTDNPENLKTKIPVVAEIAPMQSTIPKLSHIHIDGIDFPVTPVFINEHETSLYQLPIQENSYSVVLINSNHNAELIKRPIFMAEETTSAGSFTQYIIYMGAEDEMEAIRTLEAYSQKLAREFSAIRQFKWQDLKDALNNNEALFKAYISSNEVIWQKDEYFSFLPRNLVSNRKFILFEEDEAIIETPLLFLEERGKIRLICGKKRLLLNEHEIAYPHVIFSRQQGLNWQKIQEIIASLSQPIVTLDLLNVLNQNIKSA